jgi:PAS domain S-box-containing protein
MPRSTSPVEQQLHESEERYRLTFEQAAVGIAIADAQSRFKRVNRRFAAMLGYDPGELLGREVSDVSHPDDVALAREHMGRILRGESDREEFERRYIRKDGSHVWTRVGLSGARREDGSLAFFVGIVEDITELRAARLKQAALARLGNIALSHAGLAFLFSGSVEIVRDLMSTDVVEIHKVLDGALLAVGSTGGGVDAAADVNSLAQACYAGAQPVVAERENGERFPVEKDPGLLTGISVLIDSVDVPRWGVLTLRSARPRRFTTADVDFLRALVALLGQAIERRRTEVELRIRATQQSAVAELGQITAKRVTADTLERTRELLMEGLSFEQAAVVIASGDTLTAVGGMSIDTERGTHVRHAFENGTFFFENRGAFNYTTPPDAHAGIAVPIATPERRFGVVCAYTSALRRFDSGDVAFVESVAHLLADAMQRDAARTETADSEQRYRSVVEGASEIIFSLSSDGRFVSLNPAFEAVTGWRTEDWIGRSLLDLFVPDERDAKVALFNSVLSQPRHVRSHARIAGRNGTVLLDVATSPKVVDGKVVELYGFARDVTEERRLEAKLEQATRLSSLGRLAATVAHEFNNVLMGISPFTEILRRETTSERASGAVEQIMRSVKRGKRITEDILRFAQPAEPALSTVDVRPWLLALAAEMSTLVGTKYTITIDAADLRIDADANQMHQALLNLILNARDAMPEGGAITITVVREEAGTRFGFGVVESPERFAHFIVRDEGYGITPDALEHIFEPLFTTKKTGTGLGLPVARQVIARHGGEMFVESEVGRGTAFHLFIPLAEQERPADTAADTARRRRIRRVLLVEDETAVAVGLASLLEMEGIEVAVVNTGREVMPHIQRSHVDAVILDIGLPDIDGVSVYRTLAAAHPELPVIFSSGHGDASKLETYLALPHVGFLLKPYDVDALLQMLDRVAAGQA